MRLVLEDPEPALEPGIPEVEPEIPRAPPSAQVVEQASEPASPAALGRIPAYCPEPPRCVPRKGRNILTGPTLRFALRTIRAGGKLTEGTPVAALVGSCEKTPSEVARALYKGGLNRYKRGDYDGASSLFAMALEADASDLSARFAFVAGATRTERFELAMAHLGELARASHRSKRWLGKTLVDSDFYELRQHPGYWQLIAESADADQPGVFGDVEIETFDSRGDLLPLGEIPAPTLPSEKRFSPIELDFSHFMKLLNPQGKTYRTSGPYPDRPGRHGRKIDLTYFPRNLPRDVLFRLAKTGWWHPRPDAAYLVVPYKYDGARPHYSIFAYEDGGLRSVTGGGCGRRTCPDGDDYCVSAISLEERQLVYVDLFCSHGSYCQIRHENGTLRRVCLRVDLRTAY